MPEDKLPDLEHGLDDDPRPGHDGRARRPVRGRPARRRPGWDLRTVWTPGHSPGHVCFYSDGTSSCCRATTSCPASRPTSASTPSSSPTPSASTSSRCSRCRTWSVDEVLPAHEYRFADLAAASTRSSPPRRPPRPRSRRCSRAPGINGVGPHRAPRVVTAVGRDPDFMQRAADGETLAHIVLLENHGRGADGSPERRPSSFSPTGRRARPAPLDGGQRRRRVTLSHVRRRHAGQVIQRSKRPRCSQQPIGSWKMTRSRRRTRLRARHDEQLTAKRPRVASGLAGGGTSDPSPFRGPTSTKPAFRWAGQPLGLWDRRFRRAPRTAPACRRGRMSTVLGHPSL